MLLYKINYDTQNTLIVIDYHLFKMFTISEFYLHHYVKVEFLYITVDAFRKH